MITLYDYYRSSAGYRVRIALNLKGIDYERKVVHLLNKDHLSSEYQTINPQGLVPTLVYDGQNFTQSMAILEYLEEKYPTPNLYPTDLFLKSKARSIAQLIACDMHPLNNLRVLQYLVHELGVDDKAKMKWYFHWLHLGFKAILQSKKELGQHKAFLLSDEPTMADICLIPQVYNALRFNFPMDDYKALKDIYHLANEHDAFKRAQPENQVENA